MVVVFVMEMSEIHFAANRNIVAAWESYPNHSVLFFYDLSSVPMSPRLKVFQTCNTHLDFQEVSSTSRSSLKIAELRRNPNETFGPD